MTGPEDSPRPDPLAELRKVKAAIGPAWLARIKSTVTLAALVLLVFVAVRIGLDRVAEPFPQAEEAPICTPTALVAGDVVRAVDVTVSVLNAGGPDGSASRTLSDLNDEGFGRGQLGDAPEDTPRVVNSQIWTTEGTTAALKLVRSYLSGKVTIIDREGPLAGITVVVGEKFPGVKDSEDGKDKVVVRSGDETTCVPTVPVEIPTGSAAP